MKTILLTIIASTLFTGVAAQADYKCTNNSNSLLTVTEDHLTHTKEVSVLLESGDKKTQLFGSIESDQGHFLQKKLIKFYGSKGTLTIVSQLQHCGRVCNIDSGHIFSAELELDNSKTYFSCDEINL